MQRRSFLQSSAALSLLGLGACATTSIPAKAKVVVVGGGYGGATAAKYVRLLSDYKIDVVLIEPQEAFVSCPISNLVLGGTKQIGDITTPYAGLSGKHGADNWVCWFVGCGRLAGAFIFRAFSGVVSSSPATGDDGFQQPDGWPFPVC